MYFNSIWLLGKKRFEKQMRNKITKRKSNKKQTKTKDKQNTVYLFCVHCSDDGKREIYTIKVSCYDSFVRYFRTVNKFWDNLYSVCENANMKDKKI